LAISGARKEIAMPGELRWDNAEDLGIALVEKYPQQNPLEVRFTDLHRYVTELPGFADDPKTSSEAKLEAIQMAWYEEWKDSQG
jgi:FeS assembly protein IscX